MNYTVKVSDGLKWVMRPGTDDWIGPGHEAYLNDVMYIPEGGVFIDVGAHVGHFSLRLSKTASKVYAIEPGPKQIEGLKENLRLNDIKNVQVIEAAASDYCGYVTIEHPKGDYGTNGMFGQSVVKEAEKGIPCWNLDTLFKGEERIDLIKIDVQGYEGAVLRGMIEIMAIYKPRLVIELHDKEFGDPQIWDDVEIALKQYKYKWRKINEAGTNWWIEATPDF